MLSLESTKGSSWRQKLLEVHRVVHLRERTLSHQKLVRADCNDVSPIIEPFHHCCRAQVPAYDTLTLRSRGKTLSTMFSHRPPPPLQTGHTGVWTNQALHWVAWLSLYPTSTCRHALPRRHDRPPQALDVPQSSPNDRTAVRRNTSLCLSRVSPRVLAFTLNVWAEPKHPKH